MPTIKPSRRFEGSHDHIIEDFRRYVEGKQFIQKIGRDRSATTQRVMSYAARNAVPLENAIEIVQKALEGGKVYKESTLQSYYENGLAFATAERVQREQMEKLELARAENAQNENVNDQLN